MRRKYLVAAVAATMLVTMTGTATAAPPAQVTFMEVFSPNGSIQRERVVRPASDFAPATGIRAAAAAVPIEINGPSASRFDLVFVGDGYTPTQQAVFDQHVRSSIAALFQMEPFRTYRTQFNIWQVNVVSAQSGVDNDPSLGIRRTTALDMYFWCGQIERLLCVNETKAKQYAAAAPDADQVIALANSTKYGGAGGSVATAAGGNTSASQILIHELGHSIGGLADEYDNGTCDPREPREPNATTFTASQLSSLRTKWYRYLGQPTPDGGTIGTYQGARYCTSGMYRPSQNSVMRTLGRQFNLPSRDALIAGFFRETLTP